MKGARYPPAVKERAKDLWVTGQFASIAELARELEVPGRTLGEWRRDHSWDLAREVYEKRLEQERHRRVRELSPFDHRHYQILDKIYRVADASIAALARELSEAQKTNDTKKISRAVHTSSLFSLAKTASEIQNGQRKALGVDREQVDRHIEIRIGDFEGSLRAALEAGSLPGDPRSIDEAEFEEDS